MSGTELAYGGTREEGQRVRALPRGMAGTILSIALRFPMRNPCAVLSWGQVLRTEVGYATTRLGVPLLALPPLLPRALL
eukprot:2670339-Rhodomonas_salina.1